MNALAQVGRDVEEPRVLSIGLDRTATRSAVLSVHSELARTANTAGAERRY